MSDSMPGKTEQERSARVRRLLHALSPFFGLIFIVFVFALYDALSSSDVNTEADWARYPRGIFPTSFLETLGLERFGRIFSYVNLKTIAAQTTAIAIGALGMTLVIIAGGIDLSAGSTIALVTVTIALCLRGFHIPFTSEDTILQTSPIIALLAGVAVAVIIGMINGTLVTRLRIVPFIVTLGMMSAARGVAKWVSGEQKVNSGDPTWINDLLTVNQDPDAPLWDLPSGFLIFVVLAILTALLLRFTVFGRHIFAIGSNESTARLCGIRVDRTKVLVYSLAGLFVGVAGLMEFSKLSVGDPSGAQAEELQIIAAVVIGGGSLSGGKGSVLGTLIGAFIIGFLRNGCVMYDMPNPLQEVVIGAIIVAAAAVDQLQQRRRS